MGISGHILGDRKLRQLQRDTRMPFDRAYRYHRYGEGRLVDDAGICHHYEIDFTNLTLEEIRMPMHWTSCPR